MPSVDQPPIKVLNAADLESTLEQTAREGNSHQFAKVIGSVDFGDYPAGTIAHAIGLALQLDLGRIAIELAQTGMRLYPDDDRLQKAARVLKKPEVLGTRPATGKGLDKSHVWLQKHAEQYHGKWVAVRAGKLLASADSFNALKASLPTTSGRQKTLITRVL
jgi:hypothetical protein